LKTSLRSKKRVKDGLGKKKKNDDEPAFQYKNSDDEEDEFFDRTKVHKFHGNSGNMQERNPEIEVETYESIKSKLEALYKQR
jgi:hypothetical protein